MSSAVPVLSVLGERCLMVLAGGAHYSQRDRVEEFFVEEISPSQQFVKLRNMHGMKFWRRAGEVSVLEVLKRLEPTPRTGD